MNICYFRLNVNSLFSSFFGSLILNFLIFNKIEASNVKSKNNFFITPHLTTLVFSTPGNLREQSGLPKSSFAAAEHDPRRHCRDRQRKGRRHSRTSGHISSQNVAGGGLGSPHFKDHRRLALAQASER